MTVEAVPTMTETEKKAKVYDLRVELKRLEIEMNAQYGVKVKALTEEISKLETELGTNTP